MSDELVKVEQAIIAELEKQFPTVYFWDRADEDLVAGGGQEWMNYQGGIRLADRFDMKAVARAALAALRDEEWQPIETAPKDGTMVLVAPQMQVAHWYQDRFSGPPGNERNGELLGEYWAVPQVDFHEASITPTHWRPLPTPPD
jgi:hypothetical protein